MLLFWLSLIPFATSWIGGQSFSSAPMACYGFILLMCATSYILLQNKIIKLEGKESVLHQAVNKDKKGIYRGLGFDKRKPDAFYKKSDFGHTGYTGTFFFLNPDDNKFLIILTNRVNPSRTNRLMYKDDFSSKIWKQINN